VRMTHKLIWMFPVQSVNTSFFAVDTVQGMFTHGGINCRQRLLFQVLHCISLKFPNHGYVQGMAPIAATLLCYYPEDIAFVMLVRLWQDKGLKNFFSQEFDGLITAFKSLEESLKDRPVGHKLVLSIIFKLIIQVSLSIDPPSYATRWYLTLFNYSLPFHTQLRVWDALMISDDGPAMLHATALALLNGLQGISFVVQVNVDRLKETDFEKAMRLITARIDVQNDDKLMHLVFKEAVKNGALVVDF
jgi:Rab-GTPase-TBC domain